MFATVDPSAGYKGITCFVMSKDMGVEIVKEEKKVSYMTHMEKTAYVQLGIKASSTCQLAFDHVKIPKENIVGEIGKGYKVN